jgi:hypothetical protein
MNGTMRELAWRLAVVALAAVLLLVIRAVFAARSACMGERALRAEAVPGLGGSEPTVLLFSGTFCGDCVKQKEILLELRQRAGGWHLREVLAAREADLARRFEVEMVPATAILDASGRPVAVNYGLVAAGQLMSQLESARAS